MKTKRICPYKDASDCPYSLTTQEECVRLEEYRRQFQREFGEWRYLLLRDTKRLNDLRRRK